LLPPMLLDTFNNNPIAIATASPTTGIAYHSAIADISIAFSRTGSLAPLKVDRVVAEIGLHLANV
jgi:hypothetical protein